VHRTIWVGLVLISGVPSLPLGVRMLADALGQGDEPQEVSVESLGGKSFNRTVGGKSLLFADFTDSAVTDQGLRKIKGADKIQILVLTRTRIDGSGLASLERFKSLEELYLAMTPVTAKNLKHLALCPSLRELSLLHTNADDDSLEVVGALTKLETLNLAVTKIRGPGLKHLAGLTSLKELYLFGNNVDDESLKYLAGLKQLELLDLNDADVGDKGLAHLAPLVHLKYLRLDNSKVQGQGLKALQDCKKIETLYIAPHASNAVYPQLARFSALKVLFLDGESLYDSGIETIGSLKQLRSLILFSPKLNDRSLLKVKGCANLEELTLCGSGYTDRVIDALPSFPALKKLQIAESKLTEEGIRKLKEKHPKLTVRFPK